MLASRARLVELDVGCGHAMSCPHGATPIYLVPLKFPRASHLRHSASSLLMFLRIILVLQCKIKNVCSKFNTIRQYGFFDIHGLLFGSNKKNQPLESNIVFLIYNQYLGISGILDMYSSKKDNKKSIPYNNQYEYNNVLICSLYLESIYLIY